MWKNRALELGEQNLKHQYEAAGIPYSFYESVVITRCKQSHEHGELLERMRIDEDDSDYKAVLKRLNKIG